MAEVLAILQGLKAAQAGIEVLVNLANAERRELTPAEMATVRSQRVATTESFEIELARRRAEGA